MNVKFDEFEKIFLEEYQRIYCPKDDIGTIFKNIAIGYTYPLLLSMFTGFLMGFVHLDRDRIDVISIKFMNKFVKLKEYYLNQPDPNME